MTEYFRAAIRQQETDPHEGLVLSLVQAEVNGIRLTEEEIIANCILTMIGGQETATNLIGSGLLTLLRHPEQMRMLQDDPSLIPLAVEELLRFESPIQHTARVAQEDFSLGGKTDPPRPNGGGGSGGGKSRSGTLPKSGCAGCETRRQGASGVRMGSAFLLWRSAGAHGRPDRFQSAFAALEEPGVGV